MERLEDATWRKSSFSGTTGNCVEVGFTPAGQVAGIRDSKSPERGALTVSASAWHQFLDGAKSGRVDIPSDLARALGAPCHPTRTAGRFWLAAWPAGQTNICSRFFSEMQ
jgi:Domain of unknown function (DUF397)